MIFNKKIKTGKFGADMQIDFENDGPVTIIIDSKIKSKMELNILQKKLMIGLKSMV